MDPKSRNLVYASYRGRGITVSTLHDMTLHCITYIATCVFMYTYIQTSMHACMHTYIHTYIRTYVHTL